jgi:hypothetical protein
MSVTNGVETIHTIIQKDFKGYYLIIHMTLKIRKKPLEAVDRRTDNTMVKKGQKEKQ